MPIVIAPLGIGLDVISLEFGDGGRRRSAFGLAQEYLNAQDGALWGLVSDGLALRIVRDNASLTRPAWIEADLERIFTEERYSDFAALWLLAHATRFGHADQPVSECSLEAWRLAGREEGTRARAHLRRGVQDSLIALGQGFLSCPENRTLRAELQAGTLTTKAYFTQLLRLVYRLIFILTVEERHLLHPEGTDEKTKALYARGYSLQSLRERSVKRSAHDRFFDLWEATKVVFQGVSIGESRLGLPALAGIFGKHQCEVLDHANLENRALLLAVFKLAWLREDGGLVRVNWRDMGPEELGSVYESLLELVPTITADGRQFSFATGGETKGNARKTTGSYYTPDSLVQVLLDSALEPVIADTLAANPTRSLDALLGLSIVDPACGSGHFLLAAARRLAAHVARLQASGTPSAAEYRHALRLVVGRCIYGVDVNEMAVELCKVSLWMEAVEPGLPLTFLDSHIQHGNALLGTTARLMENGIPDAAWEPIEGDDKQIARGLKKRNSAEAGGQRSLDLGSQPAELEARAVARAIADLEVASDTNPEALASKESRWTAILRSSEFLHQKFVADTWCAAFVWPKNPGDIADVAPTNERWRQIRDARGDPPALTKLTVKELADQYHFFHWPLQFPQVFARGGFDVVLGNPPWERLKLQEQEWFATRDTAIANATNAASRRALIQALRVQGSDIYREFIHSSRTAEGEPAFLRGSGAFPLCGRGRDINTAAVFLELMQRLLAPRGLLGCVTPASSILGDTTKEFVWDVVESRRLRKMFHFENEETIFPGVHHAFRFCLTIIMGFEATRDAETAELVFYARRVDDLRDPSRVVRLSAANIALLSPITKTLPTIRTKRDGEIALSIFSRVPIIDSVSTESRGWNISTRPGLFHMANDSEQFIPFESLEHLNSVVPLYESKMMSLFDHRFGTYEGQSVAQSNQGKLPETSDEWHADSSHSVRARYYLPVADYQAKTVGNWDRGGTLAVREITSATSERTVIGAILPRVASGNTIMLAASNTADPSEHLLLLAALNSFVLDYLARQKVNGTHLIPSVFRQLPVPRPDAFRKPCSFNPSLTIAAWILPRVIELTYTAWDLEAFARDVLYDGPPLRWDPNRRFLLRCELDATFFHVYGLSRSECEHVMDSFPVLKKNDEKTHGEFRTKRVTLEVYDAMAASALSGQAYQTKLSPRPASPRVVHRFVGRDLPVLPSIVPTLLPDAEAAIIVWAILRANGGTIARGDLARAFVLRAQPDLLAKFAPDVLHETVQSWSRKVGIRVLEPGLLAKVLKALSERSGIELAIDASSRSIVTTSAGTPSDDQIDPWFRYEARLALYVLASQPTVALGH